MCTHTGLEHTWQTGVEVLNEPLLTFTFTADSVTRGICIYFLTLFGFCTISIKPTSCDLKLHESKQIYINMILLNIFVKNQIQCN